MSTLFARLIETGLGASDGSHLLAVIAEPPATDLPSKGFLARPNTARVAGPAPAVPLTLPSWCLPERTETVILPPSDTYPADLQALLSEKKPKRLFLSLPLLSPIHVPEPIRARCPGQGYDVIGLQAALEVLPDGAAVGAIMPAGFFRAESSRGVRSRLFTHHPPKILITHAHSLQEIWPEVGAGFRVNTVVMRIGSTEESIRFFKCLDARDPASQDDIVADFSRLVTQGGGRTKYGYVIREGLPPEAPLIHELYDPAFVSKRQSITAIGEVTQLGDLTEIRLGIVLARHAQLPANAPEGQRVRVIEGRDIGLDGRINPDDEGRQVEVGPELLLQKGDLCVAAISSRRVRIGEVTEDLLPAIASNKVLILRFKPVLRPEARQTISAYLRSASAAEYLQMRVSTLADAFRLTVHDLAVMPVPILADDLTTAVQDINKSISLLRGWAADAERERNSLFEFANPKQDRLELLKVGRLIRRRCEAATDVSDLPHRLRTRFPYPIAYRWRMVEAAIPDLEGLERVLECAEIALCYLACIALAIPGFQVKYVGAIAKRMSDSKPHGTSWGDWMAIVLEVKNAKAVKAQCEALPLGEIATLDDEAGFAQQRLFGVRNDMDHLRGAQESEIRDRFETCRNDLKQFLAGIEFVTDYRLCRIEKASWDTILKQTEYRFRELMGDCSVVPLQTGRTSQAGLEESLYVAGRNGALHLLRPFMNWMECPACKRWAVFYLDRYVSKEKKCFLKSMEHGHSADADASIVAAFQHVGLLPR